MRDYFKTWPVELVIDPDDENAAQRPIEFKAVRYYFFDDEETAQDFASEPGRLFLPGNFELVVQPPYWQRMKKDICLSFLNSNGVQNIGEHKDFSYLESPRHLGINSVTELRS